MPTVQTNARKVHALNNLGKVTRHVFTVTTIARESGPMTTAHTVLAIMKNVSATELTPGGIRRLTQHVEATVVVHVPPLRSIGRHDGHQLLDQRCGCTDWQRSEARGAECPDAHPHHEGARILRSVHASHGPLVRGARGGAEFVLAHDAVERGLLGAEGHCGIDLSESTETQSPLLPTDSTPTASRFTYSFIAKGNGCENAYVQDVTTSVQSRGYCASWKTLRQRKLPRGSDGDTLALLVRPSTDFDMACAKLRTASIFLSVNELPCVGAHASRSNGTAVSNNCKTRD